MIIEFIEKKLMEIWNECNLNPEVKERGFVFADPQKADLLITGINPSWRNGPCEQKVNSHGIATENLKPEIWEQRNKKNGTHTGDPFERCSLMKRRVLI